MKIRWKQLKYLCLVGLSGVILGVTLVVSPLGTVMAQGDKKAADEESVYLELFANIFRQVHREYVDEEKAEARKLIYAAIKGMLQSLEDPYTVFFDTEAYERFSQSTQGQYHGIGVYVVQEKGNFKIVNVIEGSPAWESGVQPNDVIIRVEQTSVRGKSIDEVTDLILGREGSLVRLQLLRDRKMLTFTLKRAKVIIKSVYYDLLEVTTAKSRQSNPSDARPIGYIRIHRFALNTTKELKLALETIKQQQAKGVVIDLRNNPGGFLTAAIEMVDLFIADGVVVSTQDRSGMNHEEKASRQITVPKFIPVVVLVNKYSASASEIFSGALMDYGRAVVVGENTFGKFSVQKEFPYRYPEPVGFKMTIARYLLPSGKSYEAGGIPVAIEVKNPESVRRGTLEAKYLKEDIQLTTALELVSDRKRYRSYLRSTVEPAN